MTFIYIYTHIHTHIHIKCVYILISIYKYTEKAMATHYSTLDWKIPWMEVPGKSHGWRSLVGLQSRGSLRAEHDWVTSLSLFTFMHWRRKWQSTPVFLPGESQGQGSLVGCHLWGCKESDTTEAAYISICIYIYIYTYICVCVCVCV